MSVINTNVKSLVAQNSLTKNNRELSVAMQRLSTGSRVNSAKDDAAGLAIGTRMNAQTRGLSMAIRNANDGISLLQTSEGALDEVTGALQRMRELAVQAVNGTNNASDRAALDLEVQQLKAEVDRIAVSTQFNNQALLDGSFKNKTLQIGDKAEQTMAVSIGSARIKDLGLGGNSSGGASIVGTRSDIGIAGAGNPVDAGDIEINGQAIGAISAGDDFADIISNIHSHVDGVKATAFNTVVMENIGTGVQDGAAKVTIAVLPIGAASTAEVSANIAASDSLESLVTNINAAMGGLVEASINEDGKLVLSNDTGAAIQVTVAGTGVAATGLSATTTFNGFLKLESLDGSPVRITRGNTAMASQGTLTDLSRLGFNETTTEPTDENYTVTGASLTSVTAGWGASDLSINGVNIYDADIATTSFAGKLNAINNFTSETGVTASAYFEETFSGSNFVANQYVQVNGTNVSTGADLATFVSNLNLQTEDTGLVATLNGTNVTLTGANVQTLTVDYLDPAYGLSVASTISAKAAGVTGSAARTITIKTADVVAGRTYELNVRAPDAKASSFTAYYTVKTGDTRTSVANGLRDAAVATYYDADGTAKASTEAGIKLVTANTLPTVASGAVLTIQNNTGIAYGTADISLNLVSTAGEPNKVFATTFVTPASTTATVRTAAFSATDFTVGKTYELRIAGGADVDTSGTVRYTVTSATATAVAAGFAAAINSATGGFVGSVNTLSKNGTATIATAATGTLTIAAAAGYGAANFRLIEVSDSLGASGTSLGAIRLDSNDNTPIQVELSATAASSNGEFGLLEQNVGASDYDVNDPSVGASVGSSLTGLSVANSSDANKAITSLDSALDQVNVMRATMGAMQNRLDRTVNNLSNVLANTEASRSRIMDTDYAVETTNLAKAQIIQQAATAMLAQANQQPQSVLALLQ